MKRLVLAALVVLASAPGAWAVAPILDMSPNYVAEPPGSTVELRVYTSAPDQQITTLQFTVCFDSTVVSFVGATIGSDLEALSYDILNLNPNGPVDPAEGNRSVLVQIYGGASNWYTGSDLEAAVLTFQIKPNQWGETPICFSEVCARTQMVTYGLESLCYPVVDLQDSFIKACCVSDAPPRVRPSQHLLEQNVPNPFNPRTTIAFTLPKAGPARLHVVSADGRFVVSLLDRVMPEGPHAVVWDGQDAQGRRQPSGVYYYVLTTSQGTESKRMLLLK